MSRLALLLVALATIAQAQVTPESAAVITKARAALAKDVATIDGVKALHFEGRVVDKDGKVLQSFILEVAQGGKRREFRYDKDFTTELTLVSSGTEGWARQANLTSGERSNARVLPFEVAANLRDMARVDLAFYAAPSGFKVTRKGVVEIDGKKVESLEYASNANYRFVRHFDTSTHLLVATDYLRPDGTYERQIDGETQVVEGIRFPKNVKIFNPKGEAEGSLIFDKIVVNGDLPASSFDFPVR